MVTSCNSARGFRGYIVTVVKTGGASVPLHCVVSLPHVSRFSTVQQDDRKINLLIVIFWDQVVIGGTCDNLKVGPFRARYCMITSSEEKRWEAMGIASDAWKRLGIQHDEAVHNRQARRAGRILGRTCPIC